MNNLLKVILYFLVISNCFIFANLTGDSISQKLKVSLKKPFQYWNTNSTNNNNSTKNVTTSLPNACRFVNVYIFNVTNPDKISEYIKPNLMQVGPYRYKVNLEEPSDSKQRTYKYIKNYMFVHTKGAKNETDKVNIVNIPYVRLLQAIIRASEAYPSSENETLKMIAAINSSIILRDVTVAEIVSEGISVQNYYKKLENVNTSILEYPKEFQNGSFYLFPKEIEIDIFKTVGTIKVSNIEGISKEKYELGCWRDRKCNIINGTDGLTLDKPIGPILNKSRLLNLFYPDLYRSVKLNFSEEINDLYVYVLANDLFDQPKNKTNCFCVPPSCQLKTGALDVSPCKKDFPLVYSLPHFLDADERYRTKFNGLRSNKGEHESFYRIDPVTGEMLFYIRRLQQNIFLKPLGSLNETDHVYKSIGLENATFPLLWTEETYELIDRMERKNKTSGNRQPKNNSDVCHCRCPMSKSISAEDFTMGSATFWFSIFLPFIIFGLSRN